MGNRDGAAFAGRPAAAVHINHYAFALVVFLITGAVPLETRAETDLAAIAQWVSAEGFAGELNGAPVRALGYEAPVPIKQKAYRDDGTVHLFYVTNSGGVLLGHVDAWATILWRFDGPELKATAYGDMVQRKMWQEPNSVHAELLAKEVSYWTDRWNEHLSEPIK